MQDWLSFFSCLFWIFIVVFYLQPFNFLKLIIVSEITWVLLYLLSLIFSTTNNNFFLINNLFYLFGFAAIEFSVGLILIIIFTSTNNNLNFDKINNFTENNFFLKNFFKKK